MRLLLDTHVWLWGAMESRRLGDATRAVILDPDNDVYVSAASIWEVALKHEVGKLALPVPLPDFVAAQTGPGIAELLDVTARHAVAATTLPRHHRDPFDRMLLAQAQVEGLTLVTVDEALRPYGVPLLWAT